MAYLDEKDIRRFARANHFPPPPPECPRSDHTRRKRVADLIRAAEKWSQDVRINLLRAGLRGNQIWGNSDE
jgi:tRNA(Ile)-lysidine synthase TilS/MesJ